MKRNDKALKSTFKIYLFYIWKKIRDARIRTKLTVYLVLIAIVCSLTIGGVSYFSMRSALIENAQDSAISLLKQVGTRMDERIREFQDATYSLARKGEVAAILESDEAEMDQWGHTLNQAVFSNNLMLYSTLDKYSDYAILESEDGEIYVYNRAGSSEKIDLQRAADILSQVRDGVSKTNPIKWVQDGDQVYFVRDVTVIVKNKITKSVGTMVFAVSESLFACGDDVSRYVSNENIVVAAPEGAIYKNNTLSVDEQRLNSYLAYQEGKYYVYTTTRKIDGSQYLVIPLRTLKYRWNIVCFVPYALSHQPPVQLVV